jgi:hypothetical protein
MYRIYRELMDNGWWYKLYKTTDNAEVLIDVKRELSDLRKEFKRYRIEVTREPEQRRLVEEIL